MIGIIILFSYGGETMKIISQIDSYSKICI